MSEPTISFQYLKPFQVDPDRVTRQEIAKLADKVRTTSKVSEIQGIFDQNISLCAYLLKQGYINYHKIYFLSTSLVLSEANRPDYLCACYHAKKGVTWHAIICAGSQEQTWNDSLELTTGAKQAFDRLNFCTSNMERILVTNQLADSAPANRIHGLLIIGQDSEFLKNRQKQARKRDINEKSSVKLRTYGAFLRRFDKQNNTNWLTGGVDNFLDRFRKSDRSS